MTTRFRRLFGFGATALVTGTAFAAGQPVVIDSEQKANMAVHTAYTASILVPHEFAYNTEYARDVARIALQLLNGSTTPAAVMNARNGLSVACGTSGNISARLARSFPRVLTLQWNACRTLDQNFSLHEYNGRSEIVLLTDSFAPEKVAALRFGTPSQDFTDFNSEVAPEFSRSDTRSVNLRIVGLIPIVRFAVSGPYTGEFAFETSGFLQTRSTYEAPPEPPSEVTDLISMESAVASGSTTYLDSNNRLVSEINALWGTVTHTSINPPPYGEITSSHDLRGLRVRDEYDLVNYIHKWSVDGSIDMRFQPPIGWSTGCVDGLYTFKSKTPFTVDINVNQGVFSAGDLLINGSTRASFFSPTNVPAGLPVPQNGMLFKLDLRNVGSFNYDIDGLLPIQMNGQCQLF